MAFIKTDSYGHARRFKYFLPAVIISAIIAWLCFSYIGMTQTPISSINISPALQMEKWRFATADGAQIAPDADGRFALPDADAVLYCTRPLADYEDEITTSALLSINSRTCDTAVYADGELIADPTHRFDESTGIFAPATGKSAAGGIFTMGNVSEITIAVRFLTENLSVAMLPSIEIFSSAPAYYSQWMSSAAQSALPAGTFLAAALFLAGLFLVQLRYKNANWGYLLLSLLSLAFCLLNTVPYSASVVWFLQSPIVLWSIQVMPTLMLLWVMWYHTQGKVRRFGWLLPVLAAFAAIAGIAWRVTDNIGGAKWTNLLQGKLLPASLILSLLFSAIEAFRGNAYYRRFFRWGGGLLICAVGAAAVSYSQNGAWWQSLHTAIQNAVMLGSLFQPMQLVNQLLLLLFFLLAIYDFVQTVVQRSNEIQLLTLQNRYAVEHAAHLTHSLDETHALRHEMRHHIEALRALCREGDLGRIHNYVEQFSGAISDSPTRYTDNALVNALVSSCAAQAKKTGADFQATVRLPERIAISDTDMTVLLSNMIDNALEAVSAVPREQRLIQIRIEIYENLGIFVGCTNSFSGKLKRNPSGELLSSKNEKGHGLGIKAMRRVAEQYNSVLILEDDGKLFHAKTYLNFQKNEPPA